MHFEVIYFIIYFRIEYANNFSTPCRIKYLMCPDICNNLQLDYCIMHSSYIPRESIKYLDW